MKLSTLLGLSVLLIAVSIPVLGQTNLDEAQGIKPFDSLHGGDLDSVSLTNGSLALHIPLASFPQRGNLDFSFGIYYSSKQWIVATNCVPNGQGGQTCTNKWEPLARGNGLPIHVGTQNFPMSGAYVTHSLDTWLGGTFAAGSPPSPPTYSAFA